MSSVPPKPFSLILEHFADWAPKVIFDVGANVGQSAQVYAGLFPEATIHAFEPSPKAFKKLTANLADLPNVVTHPFALGRRDATMSFIQHNASPGNRLVSKPAEEGDFTIMVEVRSAADVVREYGLGRIDYLKIDTEGHDYDVLLGMLPVLDQVDFVQVEAAMNPYNKTHVPLRKFEDLLGHMGFHMFHIIEQAMEWKRDGRPVLRRCNPVFINGRLVDLKGIH